METESSVRRGPCRFSLPRSENATRVTRKASWSLRPAPSRPFWSSSSSPVFSVNWKAENPLNDRSIDQSTERSIDRSGRNRSDVTTSRRSSVEHGSSSPLQFPVPTRSFYSPSVGLQSSKARFFANFTLFSRYTIFLLIFFSPSSSASPSQLPHLLLFCSCCALFLS